MNYQMIKTNYTKTIMASLALTGLLVLAPADVLAQRDFSKVQIKIIPVGGAVSMLMGAGASWSTCAWCKRVKPDTCRAGSKATAGSFIFVACGQKLK